jgi:hypothetical protein
MALSPDEVRALTAAAKVFERYAKSISSGFSRRIPAATSVDAGVQGVRVVTDGIAAPNAIPFETGEKHPNRAAVGSYRYEHDRWFHQPYRPYMLAAAQAGADEAMDAYMDEGVMKYANSKGFR